MGGLVGVRGQNSLSHSKINFGESHMQHWSLLPTILLLPNIIVLL